VNMRMKVQWSAISMQNPSHAGSATEKLFISGQSSQSIRRRLKKTAEEDSLMMPGKFSQRSRNRERNKKVRNRKQLALLPVQPHAGFMILTARAIAVATGFWSPFKASAIWALNNHFACIRRSACQYRIDCLPLRRQKAVSVCLLKCLLILQQKIRKPDHFSMKLRRIRLTRLLTSLARF